MPDVLLDVFLTRIIGDAIDRLLTRFLAQPPLSADLNAVLIAMPFYCARRGDWAHAQRRWALLAWCRVLGRVSIERLAQVNEQFGTLVDSAKDDGVVANLCETLVDVRLDLSQRGAAGSNWRAVAMFLARTLASARSIKHGTGQQTVQFAVGVGGALRSLDSAALSAALSRSASSDGAEVEQDANAAASIVRSLAALRQQALKWANNDARDSPSLVLACVCLAHAPHEEFAAQFETLLQQVAKGCWNQKRQVAEPSIEALYALLTGAPRAGAQSPFAAQPLHTGDDAQLEERLRSVKRLLFGRRQQLPRLAENVRRVGQIVAVMAAHDLPFAVEQLLPALFADKCAQPGHAAVGIEALRIMLDTRSTFWEHATGARRGSAGVSPTRAGDVSRTELLMLFKNVVLKCLPVCERFVGNAVLGVATVSLPVEIWSGASVVEQNATASPFSTVSTARFRDMVEVTPEARAAREADDEQRANAHVSVVVNDWRSTLSCQPVSFANAPVDAVDGVVASVKEAKQKRKLLAERDLFVSLYISVVSALAIVPESELVAPRVTGAAAVDAASSPGAPAPSDATAVAAGQLHTRAASQPSGLDTLLLARDEPPSRPAPLMRSASAGEKPASPSTPARAEPSAQSTSPRTSASAAPAAEPPAAPAGSGAAALPFIGQLLVHADPDLVRATSATLQSTIVQCPQLRAAVIGGFVSLVADYSPLDTIGLLTLLRHLVALLHCWHDCMLREVRPIAASEVLPATTFVQLDALALIHLCSINFGVRREARNLAEVLAAVAAVQVRVAVADAPPPPLCVAEVVRLHADDIVVRARRRYLRNLVGGVPDERIDAVADNGGLSLDDIAVSGMTELWVYVIAEIGQRLVACGDVDKTLHVVRKVLVIQLQNGARGPRESDLAAVRFSPTQRYLWLTYQCLFLALCGTKAPDSDRERKIVRLLRNYLPLCFTSLLSPMQGGAPWITDSVATACAGSNWRVLPMVAVRFARWLLTALTAATDSPRLLVSGARTLRTMLQSDELALALQCDRDGSLEALISAVATLTARMPALFGYKRDEAALRAEISREVFNDLALVVHYVTAACASPLPMPPAPFGEAAPRNALICAGLPAELQKCWPMSSRRALLLVAMQWSGAGRLAAYNVARERTDLQHELRKIKDDARRRQRRAEAMFEIAVSQRCARLLMCAVLRAGRILTREQLSDKLARDTVLDTLIGNELVGAHVLRWPLAYHFERLMPHILRRCRTAVLAEQTVLRNALFDQFTAVLDDAPRRADANSARAFDWRRAASATSAEVYTRAVVSNAAALLGVSLACLFDRRASMRARAAELLNVLVPLRFGLGAVVPAPATDSGASVPSAAQALARQLQALLVGAHSKNPSVYRESAQRASLIAAKHCAMFTEKLFAECVIIANDLQGEVTAESAGADGSAAPPTSASTGAAGGAATLGASGALGIAGGGSGLGAAGAGDAGGGGVGASGAGALIVASIPSTASSAAAAAAATTMPLAAGGDVGALAASATGGASKPPLTAAVAAHSPASQSSVSSPQKAEDALASLSLQLEILLPWCDNIALGGLKESTPDAFLKGLFAALSVPWFAVARAEPPRVLFDVWARLCKSHARNVGILVAFLLRRSLLSKAALAASKALLLVLYRTEPLSVAQHVSSVLSLPQILRTHVRDGNRRVSSLSPYAPEFASDAKKEPTGASGGGGGGGVGGGGGMGSSSGGGGGGSAVDDDATDATDDDAVTTAAAPATTASDANAAKLPPVAPNMRRSSSLSAKLVERARAALPAAVAAPQASSTAASGAASLALSSPTSAGGSANSTSASPDNLRARRQSAANRRRAQAGPNAAERSKQRTKEANQLREVAVTVLTDLLTDSFEPLLPHLGVILLYVFVRAPSPNEHAIVTRLLGAVVDGVRSALRARTCTRPATARVERLLAALDEISARIDRDLLTLSWDDSPDAPKQTLGSSAHWYTARVSATVHADELCQVVAAAVDELEAAPSGDSFSVRLGGKALAWATQFRDFRHSTKALFVMRALQQPLAVNAIWALVSTLAENVDTLVENVISASVNDDDVHRASLALSREKCIELLRAIDALLRALFAKAVPSASEAAALAFWAAAAFLPRVDERFADLYMWSVRILVQLNANKFFFDVMHLTERQRSLLVACAHDRFRGVQPCLIRGLAHAESALPCAQLLASLLLVPLDALIEPSPSRVVLCLLALLPWLATYCSHRAPPPAVAEVAQLTVRNVDTFASSLRVGETKRALLWFCSGCDDVAAMLTTVCDELYAQAFRSAAPEIAAMYAMLLREAPPPLASMVLLCVRAFMQRTDFALYATLFGAPPAPFVLQPSRQSESSDPSVFELAASLSATDGGWSVMRLVSSGPFSSVPVRRAPAQRSALDVNDLGYMPQALQKLRDDRAVTASSVRRISASGTGAAADDIGSVLYGGDNSDLDETTSLGTFVARSEASIDGVSESDFTEYTFGDNMSVYDDAQGRRENPDAKDEQPVARLSSLNKHVDARRSDDDDNDSVGARDDDGNDDDDDDDDGGDDYGDVVKAVVAQQRSAPPPRQGRDTSSEGDDDSADEFGGVEDATTVGQVLVAAASNQFPSFTSFTDDDRQSSGGSDALSLRSADFADLREASPTQHDTASPSLSFRPISPAMLFTVGPDELPGSPPRRFSGGLSQAPLVVPKSRHATRDSVTIAVSAPPASAADDDSEDDSELVNVVTGRARSPAEALRAPSNAFDLPPSPPPTPPVPH